MSDWTAEKFAQRIYDLGLLEQRELNAVWSELGTHDVPLEDFKSLLVRRGNLTNYQVDRVLSGERIGYFYGPYKVQYLIGTGTFARVYRAVNTKDDKVMAVKVLRRRHRDDPGQLDQFLREGNMGSDLRHPNIVSIHKVDSHRDAPYMVMDFVEGRNLREFAKIRKAIDVPTSLRLATDIVAGLAHAASKGITHRDLKMSNILVTSTGRAKLVDFGLAAARATSSDDELVDSPNARAVDYAALERGTNVKKDDPRSDIYFAGCIFYNMLSGFPPLTETRDRMQRLNISRFREVKPIHDVDPSIPHYIATIVNKSMELDPEKRYQTMQEMLVDLQAAQQRLESGATDDGDSKNGKGGAEKLEREGVSRTVMVVESNIEMQDMLRERLKKRGYRVLITSSPQRALDRFEDDDRVADCVLFSTMELGAAALDGFNRFAMEDVTSKKPAILLLDEKQTVEDDQAKLASHRVMMKMPMKVRELRLMLLKLLSADVEQST